jgi:hypothetical protein
MIRPHHHRFFLALALSLFAGACGQTDPSDTDTSTDATTDSEGNATVTATVSPDPVTASVSRDGSYTWTGSFVVTLKNTNTTPITIDTISADLQQTSAGIVITPLPDTDESFRFDVTAPHNRIDINGTMDIPFTFFYTLPSQGRESTVNLSIAVTTDESVAGTVTATVRIQ